MKAIMPNIIPKNITIENADKYKEVLLEPSTIFRYNKLDPLMEWQSFVFKPTQESENLMSQYLKRGNKDLKYRVYSDNPPQWNKSK